MFQKLKFNAIKAAFLALVPFLLKLKFSFVAGSPTITWPPLLTVFPDLNHLAPAMLLWFELLVRLVPSAENNSVLKLLHDILQQVVPNKATGGGFHVLDSAISEPHDDQATGSGLALA